MSWFSIVFGVSSFAAIFIMPMISGQQLSWVAKLIYFCFCIAAIISGYFGLKAKSWAFWLLFVLFSIQTIEYFTQSFYFTFVGPISLKFGWGWVNPPSHVNINILALAVSVIGLNTAISLTRRSTGLPPATL